MLLKLQRLRGQTKNYEWKNIQVPAQMGNTCQAQEQAHQACLVSDTKAGAEQNEVHAGNGNEPA